MKGINNFAQTEEMGNTTFKKLPAGGYVCIITDAKSNDAEQYMEITYDIYEGDYKKFYSDDFGKENPWSHQFRSYWKDRAVGMFKHFLACVDRSNKTNFVEMVDKGGFPDEMLNKRVVGVIFREEEYMSNKGEIRSRLRQYSFCDADDIRKGNFTVPDKKAFERIEQPQLPPADFINVGTEGDLPLEW